MEEERAVLLPVEPEGPGRVERQVVHVDVAWNPAQIHVAEVDVVLQETRAGRGAQRRQRSYGNCHCF